MQNRNISAFLCFVFLASVLFVSTPAEAATSSSINIVALGDSYTAGNGALDYEDHECWRSANAYPQQYANRLRDAGVTVNVTNAACMSAIINDVPSQILNSTEDLASADIVFITIGGNDANFVDIVINCLSAFRFEDIGNQCKDLRNEAFRSLSTIANDTKEILELIRSYAGSGTEIVLVGYPYLIANGCFLVADANNVRDLQFAADGYYEATVLNLNRELGVDAFSYLSLLDPFTGHEVCGTSLQYVRGSLDTFPTNVEEWWHPNVEGHAKISDELLNLGMHQQFIDIRSEPPPAPSYQLPQPTESTDGYAYLPFDCGTLVPYASTYDSYNYNGSVFNHGYALDFPMHSGTPITAPVSGEVSVHNDPHGYGNYIDLLADDGRIFRIAHMEDVNVQSGARVSRGKTLGTVGSTGASTGPHVHFEQRNSSGQVPIDLGGPELVWGSAQDSSGFRATTHSLLSANCTSYTSTALSDQYADILTFEFGNIRYARSDGHDYRNWEVALENIARPTDSVACDFDGDGWDEYLSFEKLPTNPSRVMMANPKGDGRFTWSLVAAVHSHTDKITCGDWNGDGKDDLILHNTQNEIIFGRSNGIKVDRWKILVTGIGTQTYWDMCDINGDGQQDLVTYESWGDRFMVGTRRADNTMRWRRLLVRVYGVGGFTCGNFTSHAGDEIVAWQPEERGRYMVGRFNRDYSAYGWNPLNPTGFTPPDDGQVLSGDIDGDGRDEFVTVEFRSSTQDRSVMVGDFTSADSFSWHPFIEGISPRELAVGNFVG